MNYTEEFILNTLFIYIFLRKMCLLFNISHVTVSQSNVQTQTELFRQVEMCLGLFSVEEWSTFGVLVWSVVMCQWCICFLFHPRASATWFSPHSFLTSCFSDFTPHLSCRTFLTQQSLVCAHLLLLWQRAADPDSPRSDAPPKRVGNGADSDTAAVH